MKLNYPLAALAAAFVLAGCEQMEQARQLTPQQRETAQAYLAERRALFVASMQEKLTEMDQSISALGDAIASLEDNAVADEQISTLRESRSELHLLFEDLAKANTESWGDAKRAFESAWADLRLAYKVIKATYDS